jgi:ribosomal protein S16
MLTIVWNPRRFHLIKVLEKGRKFNAGYHIIVPMALNSSSEQRTKIVGACGQYAPAYRQVINSIF